MKKIAKKDEFRSNINEGIKAVLFFYEKHKTQISDFHSDIFYAHIEHKKHKTSIKRFSSSEMFFMSIKILSFLFHTQKAQKAHKKHRNGYR